MLELSKAIKHDVEISTDIFSLSEGFIVSKEQEEGAKDGD
jgi:hypothetical protein